METPRLQDRDPWCVLAVVHRLWASLRLGLLTRRFQSRMPDSVFSTGGGRSSVEVWYSTALEIEALVGCGDSHVHVFVADVVKSFDTLDRVILDFVLGRLGLPGWFRRVSYLGSGRLRFKLYCGLGQPCVRDGRIPQGCTLSMVFILALSLPWCIWRLCLVFHRSCMLIISSVFLLIRKLS